MIRKRIVVYGFVQGVFFRDSVRRHALGAGVGGWVRNNRDGTVEAIFEGDAEAVERLLSREEVVRLQGLRGTYGISSPAPICADPPGAGAQADCQVVFAPPSASRLVPTTRPVGAEEGIRLTYGELTALIEDAIKNLK